VPDGSTKSTVRSTGSSSDQPALGQLLRHVPGLDWSSRRRVKRDRISNTYRSSCGSIVPKYDYRHVGWQDGEFTGQLAVLPQTFTFYE
jgi:hypothetical protein